MIELKNVSKSYGNKIVINDISFFIKKGESVAFVGENGSGKTTLAEIISKSLIPDKGEVIINNYSKVKIGFQYQENNWPVDAKGKDLIKFYLDKKNFVEENFNLLLDIFEINKIKNKKINFLSGGERQRLNCMLALINNPDILIIDEFFTGLDLKTQFRLIDFLKENIIKNNLTTIVISHIPEEINVLCERVIFLKKGLIANDINIKENKINLRKKMIDFFNGVDI